MVLLHEGVVSANQFDKSIENVLFRVLTCRLTGQAERLTEFHFAGYQLLLHMDDAGCFLHQPDVPVGFERPNLWSTQKAMLVMACPGKLLQNLRDGRKVVVGVAGSSPLGNFLGE